MSIDQYFESGEQKKVKGHFANLIKMANSEGVIGEEEVVQLRKIAKKLKLTEQEFNDMVSGKSNYEFFPPAMKVERYSRFINLVRVMMADHEISDFEFRAIRRFAAGMDIPTEKVQLLVDNTLKAVKEGKDEDDIVEEFDTWMKLS